MSQNAKVGKSSPVISQVNVARVTLRNQDMADVQSAINAARSVDNPRRKQLYELYQNLRYDGHLHAVLTKRSTNVANKKVVWVQDGASDEQMARIQEDILNTPWFYDFITGCMEVVPYGTTVLELIPEDGLIGRCEVVPRANVVPERGHISKDASNTTTPFIMYRDDPYWSTYLVEVGKPHDLGAMMIALPYILYKRGSFGDWAQFSELFGMPFRVGKYNPWDEGTRTKLLTALSEMGGAGYAVIPDGTSLDFHSSPSGTGKGEIYKDLIATCNAELSKIFLGNTLTTEQGENGARSLGDVHASVEEDLALADMRRIEFLLNWELKERLVKLGYPVADGHFAFDVTVGLPLAERVKVDTLVAQQIDVPPSYWRETYGVPEPNAQDLAEMAKRPKAPAAPKDPATPPKKEEAPEPEDEVDRAPDSATLRKELQALYRGHGHSHPDVAAGDEFTGSAAIMEELAKAMHDGRITDGFVDPKLMQWTADQLTRGVMEGFGIDDAEEFLGDPLRAHMRDNLMVFSGFKTYQTLRDASDLLINEDGQFRPFGEFKARILELDKEYNVNYLRAEYNHGVASGQMAERWQDIQSQKDLFPYLRYETVGDDRVRDVHAGLDGVVKPIDDPFWNTNYPPNGWGCRCDVVPVRRLTGKEKTLLPENYPSNPPMFANNVGKNGTVFPKSHPYYSVNSAAQKKVEAAVAAAASRAPKATSLSKTKPTGPAVSKALDVRAKGPIRTAMKDAIALIDKTHGDGKLERIPVLSGKLDDGVYGRYLPDWRNGTAIDITLVKSKHSVNSMIHEVGHLLDHIALGGGMWVTANQTKEVKALFSAMNKTKAVKHLRKLEQTGIITTSEGEKVYLHTFQLQRLNDYLLHPRELWARAYNQYIATKNNRQDLLDLLEEWDDELTFMGVIREQWTPEDFAPLVQKFDAIFKQQGWLTE